MRLDSEAEPTRSTGSLDTLQSATEEEAGLEAATVLAGASRPLPLRTAPPVGNASRSSSAAASGSASPSADRSIGSPLEALRRDEVLRTRRFCFLGILMILGGASAVAVVPSSPTMTGLFVAALVLQLGAMAYLFYRTGDPKTFYRPSVIACWYLSGIGVTVVVPYFGPFSPAPVLLVFGIYFNGLGWSRALAIALYLTLSLVQGGVATLVITGVIDDPGIIKLDRIDVQGEIVIQVLVQLVFAVTFVIARTSRATALSSIEELQRAVRLVAQREALLQEAREDLDRALQPGRGHFSDQTIGGYRLGAVIGRGAMGEVYEGQRVVEDDLVATGSSSPAVAAIRSGAVGDAIVAIKLLSHSSLRNPSHIRRFLRELESAASVISANVVKVLGVGEQPVPHLVMERLDGPTLSEVLRTRRDLPLSEVIDLVRQVGAGITAACEVGIIHRDLKPQNLVFHRGATWKILDFGVSRLIGSSDTLTSGQVVGTPVYMAPEQALGAAVTHRTDLYALSAVAYRALTGHPPFAAGELPATLYRVVHAAPRRPSDLAVLPREIDVVLAMGMAKRPEDRFATADEFSAAMAAAATGQLAPEVADRGYHLLRSGAWTTR
jgi:eukaryotic-like serine/threonine-protein kinase